MTQLTKDTAQVGGRIVGNADLQYGKLTGKTATIVGLLGNGVRVKFDDPEVERDYGYATNGGWFYFRRFDLVEVRALPLPAAEVSQGRHFEVRSASTQLSAPKAITRTSHLSKAEEFVLENAQNYNGDFEIVEVQIIQRTTVLRKVKREAVTTYKLVDA
jgi:hypothetical protein